MLRMNILCIVLSIHKTSHKTKLMKSFISFFFLLALTLSFSFGQIKEYRLDESYPINNDGRIELHSNDADVTIKGTNRSDIRLVVHREIDQRSWPKRKNEENFFIEVELAQDEAIIREVFRDRYQSNWGINVVNEKRYTIDIEVPKGLDLVIYGDDDDYLIEDISGTIQLHANDSDAELRHCTGSSFEFRLDDGDVYLSGGRGQLDMRGEDGDFTFMDCDFEEVRARIDDGSIFLATNLYNDGRYEFTSEDGDIDLEIMEGGGQIDVYMSDGRVRFDREWEVRKESEHRTQLYKPGGTARVDIETDDGSVRIKTANRAN